MTEATDDPDMPLVLRAGQGDHAACRMLVSRYLPRIHRFAYRLTGSAADADDISQDTFERLWLHAARWQPGAALFRTWLFQVARNLCTDRLRERRPADATALDTLEDASMTAHVELEQAATSATVREAIAGLPARQREALLLCHFEELSNIEAAGAMEISVEALESLLARARRTLRAGLAVLVRSGTGE